MRSLEGSWLKILQVTLRCSWSWEQPVRLEGVLSYQSGPCVHASQSPMCVRIIRDLVRMHILAQEAGKWIWCVQVAFGQWSSAFSITANRLSSSPSPYSPVKPLSVHAHFFWLPRTLIFLCELTVPCSHKHGCPLKCPVTALQRQNPHCTLFL